GYGDRHAQRRVGALLLVGLGGAPAPERVRRAEVLAGRHLELRLGGVPPAREEPKHRRHAGCPGERTAPRAGRRHARAERAAPHPDVNGGSGGNITVAQKTLTLSPGQAAQTFTLSWNTNQWPAGSYQVYARVIGSQTNSDHHLQ